MINFSLAEQQADEKEVPSSSSSLFNTSKLREEVDSWAPFVKSLRFEEDRELFKEMIEKSLNYIDSIETCDEEYTTEAFLISLLVSQQKTINSLSNQIALLRNSEG